MSDLAGGGELADLRGTDARSLGYCYDGQHRPWRIWIRPRCRPVADILISHPVGSIERHPHRSESRACSCCLVSLALLSLALPSQDRSFSGANRSGRPLFCRFISAQLPSGCESTANDHPPLFQRMKMRQCFSREFQCRPNQPRGDYLAKASCARHGKAVADFWQGRPRFLVTGRRCSGLVAACLTADL